MKYKNIFNVCTLNVRGIKTHDEKVSAIQDLCKYNLTALVIPETHTTTEEDIDEITFGREIFDE